MIAFLAAFTASFSFIFLKSIQVLNVAHHAYRWVIPTAMVMAIAESYVVVYLYEAGVSHDMILISFVGIGSGLGAMASMFVHKWMR